MKKFLKDSLLVFIPCFLLFGLCFGWYSSTECTYSHVYQYVYFYYNFGLFILGILNIVYLIFLVVKYENWRKTSLNDKQWYVRWILGFLLFLSLLYLFLCMNNVYIVYIYFIVYLLFLFCILIGQPKKLVGKIILIILCVFNIMQVISGIYITLYEPECVEVFNTCGQSEYAHNKKIEECNDKCEILEGYNEQSFRQWYIGKYGKGPIYVPCNNAGFSNDCGIYQYPKDFSKKYYSSGYSEWVQINFSSDLEKINEYNECIRKCGPMVEQPVCPA